MRRIARPKEPAEERGAVAVIVAILLVVLLGFAALAVDVGVLYAERTQLRNGADSAALAIAQKCAHDLNDAACTETSTLARTLANSNAGDGATNIKSLVLDKAAGKVTVTAGALEPGKEPNKVSLFFARVLGFNDAEVSAAATVQWGRPVAGPTAFPIAFSICQVKFHVDGGLQLLVSHGKKTDETCNYGPSGAVVPGSFGWLQRPTGTCAGAVNTANWSMGEPGNSYPKVCDDQLRTWASDITAGKDVTVLLPIFDQVSGNGSNTSYRILSFAAFRVTGWSFNGNTFPSTFHNAPPFVDSSLTCDTSCTGIIGSFVRYVSLDSAYTLGSAEDFGAEVIRLTQ